MENSIETRPVATDEEIGKAAMAYLKAKRELLRLDPKGGYLHCAETMGGFAK